MFDFPDYTFSGLLSLISAVFGISYPLLLDSISRLNDKYGGTIINSYFLEETRYKLYKYLLVFNIGLAVLMPFLLYASSEKMIHAFLVSQTAAVILLILYSFYLYELIIIYQRPDSLLGLLEGRFNGPNPPVLVMNELSLYLSKHDDAKLFFKSWRYVSEYISKHISSLKNENDEFDENVEIIINRQNRIVGLCDGDNNSYFASNNLVTHLLYPSFVSSYPHKRKHYLIWRLVNSAVKGGNLPWIIGHWSSLDQYYSTLVMHQDFQQDHRTHLDLSCVMLGGLLVFHKQYRIINEILFFSHSIPPNYYLIPNSFVEIEDRIFKLDEEYNKFFSLENTFPFESVYKGVGASESIFHECIKFLALCVIRLWSIKYERFGSEPLQVPIANKKLAQNKRLIAILELIIGCINEWYKIKVFSLIESLEEVPQAEILEKITEWKDNLDQACKIREASPQVNLSRINVFKQELAEHSVSRSVILPSKKDSLLSEKFSSPLTESFDYVIETKLFDDQFSISYTNLPSVCITALVRPTLNMYMNVIVSEKNKKFKIQRKDIFKALSKLEIDNKSHHVLVAGIYLKNYRDSYGDIEDLQLTDQEVLYRDVILHSIDSNMHAIFVIPKECLPYVEYNNVINDSSLEPLISDSNIYSNLENMITSRQPQFSMHLERNLNFCYDESSYHCVQLDVEYDSTLGPLDLDSVHW